MNGTGNVSRSGARIRTADGTFQTFHTEVSDGMVVLDAVHKIQAEQAPDLAVRWNCKAGKCGSCSAEINGKPRLMCMTRLNQLNLHEPVTVEPMRAFPLIKDLVTDVSWNFRVKKGIKKFKPRQPDAPDGTWRMAQRDVDRVQEFRKCIECFLCQDVCHVLRDHDKHDEFIGPRFFVYAAQARDEPARHRRPHARRSRTSTASATATSPSAAPRCAPSTSTSPTTRSFRSRSAWSIASTIRSRGCCASSVERHASTPDSQAPLPNSSCLEVAAVGCWALTPTKLVIVNDGS